MIYRLQCFTLVSLVLCLIFPLGVWELVPLRTSQVLAQSLKAGKAEADKLIKQGDRLSESHQPRAALQAFQQALSIYRQIQDKKGEGLTLNYIGNIYSDYLDEYNQAMTNYQQVLEIAQSINDTGLEAKALNNLGLVHLHLGNSQRATEYCKKALAVARQSKNYETEGIALKSLGAIYILTDTTKGLDFAEQALVILQKASGSPEDQLRQRKLETNIFIALGNLYYSLGAAKLLQKDATADKLLEKSHQDYQQAIKIAKEIGDRTREGKALLGIGDVYHIKSQYSKAVKAFQQSLQIFQPDKNFSLEARAAYTRLGDVYTRWGKTDQGLIYYKQALEIIKIEVPYSQSNKLEQDTKQGFLLINIGNIYADKSQYEKALDSFKQALEILQLSLKKVENTTNPSKHFQEKQIQKGIQATHLRLCLVYKFLGQPEEGNKACQAAKDTSANSALPKRLSPKNKSSKSPTDLKKIKKDLKEALESLEQSQVLDQKDLIAVDLAKVADAYTRLGEYKQAMKYFQKAIEVSKDVDSPQLKPYIFLAFGEFYEKQKQYDLALKYYKQAGEFAKQSKNKLEEATVFKQIGITGFNANKLPEATSALYRAIEVFDAIRIDLKDPRQISISETQASTYSLLQKTLIVQKKFTEALEVSERGRARAFINLLNSWSSRKSNSKANTTNVNVSQPRLQDIQKIAKQQNATIIEYSVPKTLRYKDENNDEKLLLDSSELYIWVVKPNGEVTFHNADTKPLLQKDNTSLAELVSTTRDSLGVSDSERSFFSVQVVKPVNENIERANLQKLYQLLIKPIKEELPTNPNQRVIFVPQEDLFFVPFAALLDEQGKSLIEKHTILTSPAIQVLDFTHKLGQGKTTNYHNSLIVGNPTMPVVSTAPGRPKTQLISLLGAEQEAKTIADLLKTKAIIGQDATKANILQQLSKVDVVHLATHGWADNNHGLGSWIALAPSGKDDGLLTAEEILDLKINAQLVVLSACETGKGKLSSDGVIGLSRSLISAGVPSVLVSLWKVPDRSTQYLMVEFYQSLQTQPDKALALRQAMLKTKEKFPLPRNWAAFTLIGER